MATISFPRLGEVRGLRFRLSRARLQLMGCALHYVWPRDLGLGTRGEVQDQEIEYLRNYLWSKFLTKEYTKRFDMIFGLSFQGIHGGFIY
jgi:hypothetical protein